MSSKNPDIAVMMLLYNGEEYLEQSLAALAAQTYKNFHLFIIDDGSTDNSFEIAQKYEARFEHITLEKNTENKGVIRNLRDTLRMIERELPEASYFIWACADDWWSPEYLEITRKALIEHPDASVCQTGFDKQDVKTAYKEVHKLPSIHGCKYYDVQTIFYPHITENKNGFYNQSIHGLIRMRTVRNIYPDSVSLIGYVSCTELSAVASLFLSGNILYLDTVSFHKNIGLSFLKKYPNDSLSRLYTNPFRRIWASLIHLPRFIKMRREDIHLWTVFLLWAHIFYFYGIKNVLYSLKKRLLSPS